MVVITATGVDDTVVTTVEVVTTSVDVSAGAGAGAGAGARAGAPGMHWLYHLDCCVQTCPSTQHVDPAQP